MCPTHFRIRLTFHNHYLGQYHQQTSTAPEQFHTTCPSLLNYISTKLVHNSSGLPYVKDGLLSRAANILDRIAHNPLVEESICSHRFNPAWKLVSQRLICDPSCKSLDTCDLLGVTSSNAYHCLKQAVRPFRRHVWHSLWTQIYKANTNYPGSLITEMHQASLSG